MRHYPPHHTISLKDQRDIVDLQQAEGNRLDCIRQNKLCAKDRYKSKEFSDSRTNIMDL